MATTRIERIQTPHLRGLKWKIYYMIFALSLPFQGPIWLNHRNHSDNNEKPIKLSVCIFTSRVTTMSSKHINFHDSLNIS